MTTCDAELAFLDELAEAAGLPVEEKKEDADIKPNEQQGNPSAAEDGSAKGADGAEQPKAECNKEEDAKAVKAEPNGKDSKGEEDDDDETFELDATDLLNGFKAEEEKPEEPEMDADALMKMFMDDMKEVNRGNEVHRILGAFKLNPFEQLNLRFTATEQDVKRAYKKLSLMVHPDKCAHEQAPAAFEVIGEAQKFILDGDRREGLMRVLEYAREAVREVRRKATKNDSAVRMAAALHAEGRAGVEKEWEETDDFHEKWRIKAQDVLARSEFRRRKLLKRQREEDDREDQKRKEENAKRKQMRNERKEFLDTRTQRINAWRDYKQSGKKVAGTKAPKIKTFDSDRTYVQRATTEQFVGNYKKKPGK